MIGVASADLLAARGARVVLLERGEVASGASYGNAGWISPSHGTPLPAPGVIRQALRWLFDPESPFYVKPRLDLELARWLLGFLRASTAARARATLRVNRELILASLERYEKLAAEPGLDFGFAPHGLVVACESHAGLAKARHELELIAEYGGTGRALGADELRARVPRAAPGLRGGVWFPQDAHLDPARLVRALAERAARAAHGSRRATRCSASSARAGASRGSSPRAATSAPTRSCSPPAPSRPRSPRSSACACRCRPPRATASRCGARRTSRTCPSCSRRRRSQ